jgi:UDP-GlcNAc:undecaprenyl-phosphate/decaprenyl-phosphate GlcNAc-1-phosphate transferase
VNYLLEFFGAAALAFVLTAFSRPLALRTGAVARLQPDRWHKTGVIPRLSGPALLCALVPWVDAALCGVLALFCAIGVWDDYRPMPPLTKGCLLAIPCAIAGWILNEPWIVLALWVSANAFNMLDHADGAAAAAGLGSLVVAGGVLGMSGAGACLGFLAHNWPPARAFLGDGGSLMLGAALLLAWYPYGILPTLAGLSLPLIDAVFVIGRRLQERRTPWTGGTDHTGHALLRSGLRPAWLPIVYCVTSGSLAFLAKAYT